RTEHACPDRDSAHRRASGRGQRRSRPKLNAYNQGMAFTHSYTEREPTRAEVDALSGPVVLEFGAPWCPHCIAIQSTLEALLQEHPSVKHIKIYDGRGKPLGRSFRVKLWPSLIFMRDGKVLQQLARPDDDAMRGGLHALMSDD